MLKRLLLVPLAALALASCGTSLTPSVSPGQVADTTVRDEQAALGVETMYQGWRAFVETGVDLGLIRGERATRFAAIDRQVYGYLKIARQAYDTGQTQSYAEASAAMSALIANAMAELKKGT